MLLSIGDFLDLYFQLQRLSPIGNPLLRLFMRGEQRTRTWWRRTGSPLRNWWDIPAVIRRWNEKISGDPSVSYMQFVGNTFVRVQEKVRLLSIGCGTGCKEIAVAAMWPNWTIEGFDASHARIKAATNSARKAGIQNASFFTANLSDFSFPIDTYDIVLFDSSLHHFKNFDCLFSAINPSLTKSGLVVINEYTGPDRFQWPTRQLDAANALLRNIPRSYRQRQNSRWCKNRIFRPGYLRMLLSDPSEAINSSQILPSLHAHFVTLRETALGGNLLHLILKDIAHHFIAEDATTLTILKRLFDEEDRFIDGNPSDFTFGVYRKAR